MKQKNTLSETYTLMNGINIPKIGLGTWFIPDDEAAAAVCKAVEIGYRHIDTAQAYENERGIGKGVRDCGISRQELFITTKLAAELKTYEEAAQAITGSLEKMGLDYIDLMLIHSPQPWTDFRGGDYAAGNREAWRALEDAYKAGKIRAIGISNFQEHDIENKGGQILLCTAGRGYYQEWGKEAQELHPGDVVNIPPEVKHWHGAAKDSWFAHLAVEVPAEGASNEWLEVVNEEDYEKLK